MPVRAWRFKSSHPHAVRIVAIPRIPRSREGCGPAGDDDEVVDDLVLRVALVVLAISAPAWAALSLFVVVGRLRYERLHRNPSERPLRPREAERLVRKVAGRPRTEWGRWRRVTALQKLERTHHPAGPRLLRRVLHDPDPKIAAAAIRTLGDVGDDWAVDVLVDALRDGEGARSRIASELERLAPAPGPKLVTMLRSRDAVIRFWGATLLRPYPDLAEATLIELTWDSDSNVRAAAVETLGTRHGPAVEAALSARLDDSEWFVRVHAARAVGHVVGVEAAPSITRLLSDRRWWVRTAAKDALRGMGAEAVPSLLATLTHEDLFARNGAAEVLQDVGFVDFLALDNPRSPLLERIYEAGGERFRAAAEARVAAVAPREEVRAA